MATITLHGAKTYAYGKLVFTAHEPAVVDDKIAEELAALPEYFTVVFDGRKAGARRTAAAAAEPVAAI